MILRLRVVLKANSQSDSQDLLAQEARSSWESQQEADSYGKPEAKPVKLQDARRQNNVTKLIKMFEKHQHKEQFSLKT